MEMLPLQRSRNEAGAVIHKHWQDMVNAVLGFWLSASLRVLRFQGVQMAMIGAVVLGIALVAPALGAIFIFVPREWKEWSEAVLSVLVTVSLRQDGSAWRHADLA